MRPLCLIGAIILIFVAPAWAGSTVTDLKAEVERLRKEINARQDKNAIGSVDSALSGRFGPHETVEVRSEGVKLEIQGLLQVWFQSVKNDHSGVTTAPFSFPTGNALPEILAEQNE